MRLFISQASDIISEYCHDQKDGRHKSGESKVMGIMIPKLFVMDSMSLPQMLLQARHAPALMAAAKMSGILSEDIPVSGISGFKDAIAHIGRQMLNDTSSYPLVHIACHGSKDGLQLMSGEEVTWSLLAEIVRPLHLSTRKNLVLGLSSCFGSSAGPAMTWLDVELPCKAIFGPRLKVQIGEAAIAWSVLYHNLSKASDFRKCRKMVHQMNVAIDKLHQDGFTYFDEHRKEAVVRKCRRQYAPAKSQQNQTSRMPVGGN